MAIIAHLAFGLDYCYSLLPPPPHRYYPRPSFQHLFQNFHLLTLYLPAKQSMLCLLSSHIPRWWDS